VKYLLILLVLGGCIRDWEKNGILLREHILSGTEKQQTCVANLRKRAIDFTYTEANTGLRMAMASCGYKQIEIHTKGIL
jgi:hypothetical protein